MKIVSLVPAFNPGEQLVGLVESLMASKLGPVIIVDDGSRKESASVFGKLARIPGCHLVRHDRNHGKGRALKTGFGYFRATFPDIPGIVTVDADGQHLPEDVVRVCRRFIADPSKMVIGGRNFSGDVPVKSMLGNLATRRLFYLLTGQRIFDTQTGLRCIPRNRLAILERLPGERFEYEMNVLLSAGKVGLEIVEEEIATVYHDSNSGSSFRPVADSLRIVLLLARFALSPLPRRPRQDGAPRRRRGEA